MAEEEDQVPTQQDTAPPEKAPAPVNKVVIRPYPKVIFFYPTFLVAVFCWLLLFSDDAATAEVDPMLLSAGSLGFIFCLAFTINILVISFEFNRIVTITCIVLAIALLFGSLWLNGKYEFAESIAGIFGKINIVANQQFYGYMSLLFFLVYLFVFVTTRFNYYEITHNEILHHHGYLGDIERFPAPNLRLTKEINDVFEFALALSGRLILFPANERKAIVLDNVLHVNKIETHLTRLLGQISVKISG